MEVLKIPQQKENLIKALEDEIPRESLLEATTISQKPQVSSQQKHLGGKVPPFFISLETEGLIIHNCMVESGATYNIMPLSFTKTMDLDCTKYYEASESIFAIDLRKVLMYEETKDFYAWISLASHVKNVFTIIVFDLPPTYGLVLCWEWSYPLI